MVDVPLGIGWWKRPYAQTPESNLRNRFFEEDPTNSVNKVSLLSRPPTSYFTSLGPGPGRATFTQEGTFDGALFVVSGEELWELNKDMTSLHIAGTVQGAGNPSLAATEHTLWVADGISLQFFDGVGSHARGTLTSTGTNVSNNDTVTINGHVYTFKTVLAGANTVKVGADATESLTNLSEAINADPATIGINYGTGTVENAYVYATTPASSSVKMVVNSIIGGTAGNAYTTTEAAATLSWGGATLSGGVADALSQVATPDDVGIVSVCVLGSYTFCLVSDSEIIYWINPGEYVIDPLNRIAAEAIPDQGIALMTVGDQFWCFGASSTQPFYLTGDETVVAPIQGRAFSRGSLEGTPVLTNDEVVLVGDDGIVYAVGGGPRRISTHAVEELIRTARKQEREAP